MPGKPKGLPKTGGRKKGTPNKTTSGLKSVIGDFVSKKVSSIDELYDKLEPKEQADFLIKLIPYVMPKVTDQQADKDEVIVKVIRE